jgi:transposase InsO family protein
MGEVGNCYENALAERMNGILKCEYGLDDLFIDYEHAQKAVREAIWLYNYDRPHLSLNYCKPAEVYFQN